MTGSSTAPLLSCGEAKPPAQAPGTDLLSAREGYSIWAASYDTGPNPLLALEERKLELLLPDTREKDVIDLGCGTGRWLRRFLERGARSAVGVDFTLQMVSRAAQHAGLKHHLVLGDCLMLPFGSQVADVVVCSLTVGHIQDLSRLAQEIARISRPQAELFLSDLHPHAQAAGWRCAFRYEGRTVEIGAHQHARVRVQEAFRSAGFSLRQSLDSFVGEPERHIFVRGGKDLMFEAARAVPALAIDHFVLVGRPHA